MYENVISSGDDQTNHIENSSNPVSANSSPLESENVSGYLTENGELIEKYVQYDFKGNTLSAISEYKLLEDPDKKSTFIDMVENLEEEKIKKHSE